jgi:hypothetical protein
MVVLLSVLAKLPLSLDRTGFASAYGVGLAARSICVATFLYVLGFPLKDTLQPVWIHYWRQNPRLLILTPLWQ